MRYRSSFFILIAVLAGISACELDPFYSPKEAVKLPMKINAFSLGYVTDIEGQAENADLKHQEAFTGSHFIPFTSDEQMESAQKQHDSSILRTFKDTLDRQPYDYSEDLLVMTIQTAPGNASIDAIEVTSSNPKVLQIVEVSPKAGKIIVRTVDLGSVDLHVKVVGPFNSLEQNYSLNVVTKAKINYYITPYWLFEKESHGHLSCRLWYRISDVCDAPSLYKAAVQMVDSITVVANCEYFDVRHSRLPYVDRDTLTIRNFVQTKRLDSWMFWFMKNISDELNTLELYNHRLGYELDQVTYDIVPYRADFVVHEVILSTKIICSNPFVSFELEPRIKSSTKTWTDEDGEHSEEEVLTDQDYDFPKTLEEDKNNRKLKREEKAYFQVELCDFSSNEEKASAYKKLDNGLKEVGYYDKTDDSNLTEEEKEKKKKEEDEKLAELDRRQREGDQNNN